MEFRILGNYFYFRCRTYERPKEIGFAYRNESRDKIEAFIIYYENSNNRIRGMMSRKRHTSIDFILYMAKVYDLTESNCKNVNDIDKRNSNFHLDHIVPISYGYENNISINKMASFENLQIISKTENVVKGNKITQKALDLLKKWDDE